VIVPLELPEEGQTGRGKLRQIGSSHGSRIATSDDVIRIQGWTTQYYR
jgi:hypothetical protein